MELYGIMEVMRNEGGNDNKWIHGGALIGRTIPDLTIRLISILI